MNKKTIFKIIIFICLAIGLLIGLFDPEIRAIVAHPHRLKVDIMRLKNLNPIIFPIVFMVLYVLRTLLIIFPINIFAIASGALFGKVYGLVFVFVFSMIAAFLSATISFWLGKSLLLDFVQKHLADKIKFLKERNISDFKFILYLRIIMIMPFDALGYVAGAANIKYKDFILGTMIGIIPEFLVYSYLGSTGARKDIPLEKKLLISAILLTLLLLGHFGKKVFEKFINKKDVYKTLLLLGSICRKAFKKLVNKKRM